MAPGPTHAGFATRFSGAAVDVVPTALWGGGQRSGPWLFFGGSRVTDTTYTMKEPIKLWSPWRTAQQIMR